MEVGAMRRLALGLSDKKLLKLKWNLLEEACAPERFLPFKLDVERPLEEQGPIDVLIHKLTDTIAAADAGDVKAREVMKNVEQYISNHPEMIVIDPIENVKILIDRYKYYSLLENHPAFSANCVFTPRFCVLTSNNLNDNLNSMLARSVTFPVVCKTLLAHGSRSAHKMSVIFNEAGLADCKPPCIVQKFINHNAVLYKIFVVGNRYYITDRPSLKNFYACNERETIHFHSGDVCKADSQSTLSILDPHEIPNVETKATLDEKKIEVMLKILREELNLTLFGIDIVVDNITNRYAIIDINFYPGYEGFPNFFAHLIDCIDEAMRDSVVSKNTLVRVYRDDEIRPVAAKHQTVANDKEKLIELNISKIEDFYEKI
ncbi:inositol-tetrakisphosphate 1-kinase-like [Arctopsyche grandis]|uniref:inositol-tetrakisphosphate 1-kinase-like n=1 Tax=Arctopsyche grandis TaxID=121162 RepID=UPI00406D657D